MVVDKKSFSFHNLAAVVSDANHDANHDANVMLPQRPP